MHDSCTRITLDVQNTAMPVTVKAKRGDTARRLLIHLTDGGVTYHITEDCYATFTAVKADGTKIHNPCTIENCVITYPFTQQTCAALGRMIAEIKLYGADEKLITSASFLIDISDTVYTEGDEISSEGEMGTLDALIAQASGLIHTVEEKLEKGELAGKDGNSIFWYDNTAANPNIGAVVRVDYARIAASGKTVRKEDYIICSNGCLYRVEDVYPAQNYCNALCLQKIKGETGVQGPQGQPGKPGKDYVLTENDKNEIAEKAAGLVDLPDSGGNVDQSGLTAAEKTAIFNLLQHGVYDGYEATADLVTLANAWGIEIVVDATGLYLNSTSGVVEIDDTFTLIATVEPSTATNKTVTWASSNETVATVTDNGDGTATITAISAGSATITATTVDGGHIASYKLTVQEEVTYYSVAYNLTNATSSNNATSVAGGSNFITRISVAGGYSLVNVSVSMGGIDVTDDVYADGTIDIESVTGDITITAEGVESANAVILRSGFLDSTTTATSEPTTNAQYKKAWCSTAVPVLAGDTVTWAVNTDISSSEGTISSQCRTRKYDAEGAYVDENNRGISYTATTDGYVRFMCISDTYFNTLTSVIVTNDSGTTTYSVIDNK